MPSVLENPSFETGTLAPWVGFNATVTPGNAHQGFFKAELGTQDESGVIYQLISVAPGDTGQLILSLTKATGEAPSPLLAIVITYFDADFNFIETGLLQRISTNELPLNSNQAWKTVYSLTLTVPPTGSFAIVSLSTPPLAGASSIFLDDVELVFA